MCSSDLLGTGQGSSVLDMVHAFEKACGHPIAYKVMPRRAGDIGSCFANADKAKQLLNWEAKKSVEEACVDTWRFASKHYA